MPLPDRLAMLDRHLFEIEGFSGNRDDYFDPRNSFLNDVIERRTGIPITLSVVYLEVGWRLGLPLVPVSFPAHFLVASTGCPARLHRPVQPRRPPRARRSGGAAVTDGRRTGAGPANSSAGDGACITPGGCDADPAQSQADLRGAAGQ